MAKKRKIDLIKNAKHKSFALEYIRNGRNGTKAYRTVYPKAKYTSAMSNANKMLRNTQISEAILEYYNKLWDSKEKEIGQTFDNLLKMANADISDVVEYSDEEGMTIKDFDTIDTQAVQSISENVSQTKYGPNVSKSIKMYDKQKAISDLLKVLNMITEKVEHSGTLEVVKAVRPDKFPDKKKNES